MNAHFPRKPMVVAPIVLVAGLLLAGLLATGCIQDQSTRPCTPETCTSADRECGLADDGCGNVLDCGGCSAGYSCSEDGACLLDVDPCVDHCTNGVQDCGETGIDCGGDCGICYCPNEQIGDVTDARQWKATARTFDNPGYEGNPFDLEARATFMHCNTGTEITTRLFYNGNDQWGVHFTGTAAGRWIFEVTSDNPVLGGQVGTILVAENGGVDGFHTQFGTKWGWTGTNRAFVPQLAMIPLRVEHWDDAGAIDQLVQVYLRDHGFNGVHTGMSSAWYDHNGSSVRSVGEIVDDLDGGCPDPDIESFVRLKRVIEKVHDAGGMVHIWQWADSQRRQTPNHLPGGANGPCDRRIQKYIAAYLGPVPGWSMGYGFDVQEYAGEAGLADWHEHMTAEMGSYFHPMGARWGDDPSGIGMYYTGLSIASYQQHRPAYDDYRAGVLTFPDKLQFSEDRFRLRPTCGGYPDKDYTLQMIRRGLWSSTLAGGTANIWGVLAEVPSDCVCESQGFPRPDWIKTWARFWKWRFLRDLEPCDHLVSGGAHCLMNAASTSFVFYVESSATLSVDLTTMVGDQPVVAVNTALPYEEISLPSLSPGQRTFDAPGGTVSDWAVAVGPFVEEPLDPAVPIHPTGLVPDDLVALTPDAQSRVTLTWRPVPEATYRIRYSRLVPGGDLEVMMDWTDATETWFDVAVTMGEDYQWKVQSRSSATGALSVPSMGTFRVREADFCGTERPTVVHDRTTLEAFIRACFANTGDNRAEQNLPVTDCESDFQALMREVRDLLIQTYPTISYTHPSENNHCRHLDAFAILGEDGNRYIIDYVVNSSAGGILLDKLAWQASDANVCE